MLKKYYLSIIIGVAVVIILILFFGLIIYFKAKIIALPTATPTATSNNPYVITVPEEYLATHRQGKKVFLSSQDPFTGTLGAPVELILFGGLEQTDTRVVYQNLKQLLAEYPDKLVLFWKDYTIDPAAQAAAAAAHCAGEQQQFWPYLDLLMGKPVTEYQPELYPQLAAQLNLESTSFNDCLSASDALTIVTSNYFYGRSLEISTLPALYINDQLFATELTLDNIKQEINVKITP